MSNIRVNEWFPSDNLILEPNALQAVKSDRNTIVLAGPGAGKTELLAQRACFLLQTNICRSPKKILAISFKKDAAKNLQERVKKRCGKELTQRFRSMTYDAFAKSLVDRFLLAIPELYRPVPPYDIASWEEIRQAYHRAGFIRPWGLRENQINSFLEKDVAKYTLPIPYDTEFPTQQAWQILLRADIHQTARLSFPMITRLASYLIQTNPMIKRSLQLTYSHIFLDEFQDTTSPQYELIKACFYNSTSVLTAVGDLKQRIMIWAGAKKDVFPAFAFDFNTASYSLTMNHRSAPRLIEVQKTFFSKFNETSIEVKPNPNWDEDDGKAISHIFENDMQEANIIANIIQNSLEREGFRPNDICVLVRHSVERYSNKLMDKLSQLNIKARNEGEYQELLNEELIILLINTLFISIDKNAQAWRHCCEILAELRIIDYDSIQMYSLQKELKHFASYLSQQIIQINSKQDIKNIIDLITDFYSISAIQSFFLQYSRISYIDQLKNKMTDHLWSEYKKNSGDLKHAIDSIIGKDTVPIMTIHKSKGLEYRTVIFLGLEDGAFFDFNENEQEDTAAFFVALSRAKETIHFTFSKRRDRAQFKNQIGALYDALKESGVVEERDHS